MIIKSIKDYAIIRIDLFFKPNTKTYFFRLKNATIINGKIIYLTRQKANKIDGYIPEYTDIQPGYYDIETGYYLESYDKMKKLKNDFAGLIKAVENVKTRDAARYSKYINEMQNRIITAEI